MSLHKTDIGGDCGASDDDDGETGDGDCYMHGGFRRAVGTAEVRGYWCGCVFVLLV